MISSKTFIADNEFNEVLQIVGNASNGVKISDVVNTLAMNCHIEHPRARYIVRAVIDRSNIHTDSKFRLHLTEEK
jgi:hypothetical protein